MTHASVTVENRKRRGIGDDLVRLRVGVEAADGVRAIRLKGGFEAAKRFCERTELFTLAESLGGVESLSNHPAVMTHASVPVENRKRLGIGDELVRLSVGVESVDDLRADLDAALS